MKPSFQLELVFYHHRENEVGSLPTIFFLVHFVRTRSHSQLNVNNYHHIPPSNDRATFIVAIEVIINSSIWRESWKGERETSEELGQLLRHTLQHTSLIRSDSSRQLCRTIARYGCALFFLCSGHHKIFLIEKIRPVDLNLSITLTMGFWP